MPSARVGGVRLHYERSGSGEPLLWLPGFVISGSAFEAAMPLYRQHYDCITFDNRFTGRSSGMPGPTSMPQLAGDAVGLLDALGLPSAHVYGLSYGGMVAQEMAIRFPDRVRALILGGTSPGGPLAFRPTARELAALGVSLAHAQLGRRRGSGLLFSEEFTRADPQRARALTRQVLGDRPSPPAVAAHLLASVYHDTVFRLPEIAAPTLVLHGAEDRMTPVANARLLAERIPDAELVLVPGAGHAYLLEQPEESARIVREWLARRGPVPAGPRRRPPFEPATRQFGLTVGAFRTGASLLALPAERWARRLARRPAAPDSAPHDSTEERP